MATEAAPSNDSLGDKLVRNLTAMKADRQPHEFVWSECYSYTFPLAGSGLNGNDLDAQSGAAALGKLCDGTAADSVKVLVSGIVGGMTPSNTIWFGLEVNDATDDENRWLFESAEILWKNIHGANYDASAFDVVRDAVIAGWFVLYIDEDREEGGFVFEQWPLSQCFIAASKPGGRIDIIKREYEMTAEQAVAKFGAEKLSQGTQDLAKNKPNEKVKFVHCIEPRQMYVVGSQLAKNLPFSSITIELNSKKVVKESGYHEFPCVVPRVTLIPKAVYAVGWVYDAMPDIRSINEVKRLEFANLDLAVAGMYVAVDDGVLNAKTIKVGGRKVIVANSIESIKPLSSGVDFQVAFVSEDKLTAAIRKTLLADQLPPLDGPARTATEFHARIALLRQLLGPVFGRFQSEWLQPMIERCFGLAMRAGIFSPPPRSLLNREFTVKFLSPLARAQQLEEVSAINQHIGEAMAIVQADPTMKPILDNIDFDEAIRFKGEARGIPPRIQRTQDDILALRQARESAAQQAQQQETMQPVVQEAGKAVARKVVGA